MKKIFILLFVVIHTARANPDDLSSFNQEMDFLKQNSFIESDQLRTDASTATTDTTETETGPESTDETIDNSASSADFVDLDKKFFSDEVKIKKSAPKRRAVLEENFMGDDIEMESSAKNEDETQKIDKPSFFKRLLNNEGAKKIDGSISIYLFLTKERMVRCRKRRGLGNWT